MNKNNCNYLYDSLFGIHQDNPDIFLKLENGREVTYSEFVNLANRYAGVFSNQGVVKSDRVLVKVNKSVEALAIYVACIQIGAVLVPLNTAYTKNELEYFINDAQPSLIITDQSQQCEIEQLIAGQTTSLLTLNNDATGTLVDHANEITDYNDIASCQADTLAAILYTSGTTGKSKGAMLTHVNLLSNTQSLVDGWQFSETDVLLHALPLFHIHGLFVAFNVAFLSGCSVIFLPSFNIDSIIESLPDSTTMMGVPTFYTRLLNDQRFDKNSAEHMRLFVSGSAPMLEETHQSFQQRTGHRILERYGMTETNMNTSNPYSDERRIGTVGLPLNNVSVRISHPDSNKSLNSNEVGVIQVKGPNVFKGYWKMPEKTAEEFSQDGYFITGDLGFLDDDGYLTIVGRQKDLIISGGYNVYPKEVETILDEVDGVLESAVIGITDSDFGEKVIAIVVKAKAPFIDENSLIAISKQDLAGYKCPKQVFFIDELPRNTMGKVQKNLLREQFS